jgi:hypothetical protein
LNKKEVAEAAEGFGKVNADGVKEKTARDEALEEKKIEDTEEVFEGCPLKLMGPPVEEVQLINWCFENMEKLDTIELRKALITVLSKTMKKKGYEVEKQRLHRSNVYRLKTESGLLKTEVTVLKEE